MRSIDATSKRVPQSKPRGILVELARKILLSRFEKIEVGHLTVKEGEQVYSFGQRRENAELVGHIYIHDPEAYARVLSGGTIGSGEAFMLDMWSSPDVVAVIRIISANQSALNNMESRWSWFSKATGSIAELLRKNTLAGSRKNISAHYDLSNDFFSLFLDPTMMYSSAIFPDENSTLEEASRYKLDHICQRLQLNSDDHLLEIGTGWGGMAIHAAKHYGCRVTTTTISQEQYDMAVKRVREEGLDNRVDVLKKDYRDLNGKFDKIVSIEMVEAVGYQYYHVYFDLCSRLLKSDGLMLMQAITTQDQRYEAEKNSADFIRRYIFPGGCLPSNEVVIKHLSKYTDMHLVALDDITLDYARTLAVWKERFFHRLDDVKALGFDEVFIRMWDYYLSYCEGGFRERVINTSQFLFAKPRAQALPVVGRGTYPTQ